MAKSRPRRQGKKKKKRSLLFIGIILLLVFLLSLFFFLAPIFQIHSVRIEGNRLVSKDEIMEALGPVESNLFVFDAQRATERLLGVNGIESVSFGRELPDRLVVRVDETYVIASLQHGDKTLYLNEEGVLTETFNAQKNRIRPFPITVGGEIPSVGNPLFEDARNLELLLSLAASPLQGGISKVSFESASSVDIMYNDLIIHFGVPNDILKKISDSAAVIRALEKNQVKAREILLDQGQNPIVVTEDRQPTPDAQTSD